VTTSVQRLEEDDVDVKPAAGVDVKYAVGTQSTLDLTVNTDFSQVEADEQQINLTRFNLFFPEKREFFLENAGVFGFGRSKVGGFRKDLIPFFSRRIGISDDRRLVPILGGARLSGRAGKNTFGLLNLQTDEIPGVPSANFSVLRVRRDIFAKSDIGGLFVTKQPSQGGFNHTYGVDANFRLLRYLEVASFVLKTESPDRRGRDLAANFEVAWRDDLFDLEVRHQTIQENFNPEVGFIQRGAVKQTSGIFTITGRPGKRIPWIRYAGPSLTLDYFSDQQGAPETRFLRTSFDIVFQNGAEFSVGRRAEFERLAKPFQIHGVQQIAPGDYSFDGSFITFKSDKSRTLSGEVGVESGSFWDGTRASYLLRLDLQPGRHFGLGAVWTHNDVDLPSGPFKTSLLAASVRYLFTTRLFLNALIQYNSDTREVDSNVRFNFIHGPLSDFFLVYNERRASTGDVIERAVIATLTYMLGL
jgi:hypothetical protein